MALDSVYDSASCDAAHVRQLLGCFGDYLRMLKFVLADGEVDVFAFAHNLFDRSHMYSQAINVASSAVL